MGLMQLMKGLWFLLIALAIVSMGQALNPEQKLAPTTGAALQLLTNGDQQLEVPASLPSFSDDRSESTSIPIDQASLKHSQSSIDELFDNITYAPHDIENSDGRYSPKHHSTRDDQNLDLIGKYATSAENVRIASTDTGSEIGTNMGYIYRSASNDNVIETNRNELQRDVSSNLKNIYSGDASGDGIRIADKSAAVGGLINNYYYEKKSIHDMTLPFSKSDNDILSNLEYIYKNSYLGTQKENTALATETTSPNLAPALNVQFPKPVIDIIPNLKYLYETSTTETAQTQVTSVSDIEAGTNFNINRLTRDNANDMILPDLIAAGQEDLMNLTKNENLDHLDGKARTLKNYAVVVGINNYTDRSSLHTSVNDAETMAALLESYGYNVVKLTDITDEKPTKSNILEKALGEMKNKKDLGKVLIYFSGHGEEKGNNYYLIPQDGNGHTSSYISTQELQKSMKGLKNVALVVDACNAGELENVIDNGQMILASSRKDQPSNEVWFGSLSLFTYNLCNAMRDEEKISNTVILERCFYKAREATERWASWRLLVQTPEIKDKTSGYFSLK